jgi:hypothetical protein
MEGLTVMRTIWGNECGHAYHYYADYSVGTQVLSIQRRLLGEIGLAFQSDVKGQIDPAPKIVRMGGQPRSDPRKPQGEVVKRTVCDLTNSRQTQWQLLGMPLPRMDYELKG